MESVESCGEEIEVEWRGEGVELVEGVEVWIEG